ncbi:MAG TPA: DUF4266 domain-containing protein [Casimicrobiaceae bacterium]|jgi:uncharacterized protein DUF4266|nr:DUF4266 domain-containing protein [Casimicrobiaceae bacterium]
MNHASRKASTVRAAALAAIVALAGCATFDPPRPWEKGDLARPSMRLDADPLATRVTQHVYQSKEGAAGGGVVGGGGCGCN